MNNITVKEYTELQDTSGYDAILHCLNPVNNCAGMQMNVNQMPYANVKHSIRLISKVQEWKEVQELFEICFDIDSKAFWSLPVTEFFGAKNYMMSELERVISTEAKLMSSQSTDEYLWEMAGAEKLRRFNDTLPLIQLGKLFGQYPFDIGRKPYGEVFSLLVQVKVQNEVEVEYQKLKK